MAPISSIPNYVQFMQEFSQLNNTCTNFTVLVAIRYSMIAYHPGSVLDANDICPTSILFTAAYSFIKLTRTYGSTPCEAELSSKGITFESAIGSALQNLIFH